jgi:hypothetical protein
MRRHIAASRKNIEKNIAKSVAMNN